jgi:hypothetical protein
VHGLIKGLCIRIGRLPLLALNVGCAAAILPESEVDRTCRGHRETGAHDRSCRYRRHRGERNERSALRRLAGLIGALTGSPLNYCAIPRMHTAGGCQADTIDLRWIVLAKSYRLAALGWT